MGFTITQLRAFVAVARAGSVTAAAEELVVSQPAVSGALAALGEELGVAATERIGRGIRLSAAGEAFLPYATDILGLLAEGRLAAQEAAGRSERLVRIAAVTTAGEHLAPPLLRAFRTLHPDVELTLEVANRERVFRSVIDHAADVGIGGRATGDPRLVGEPFLPNELVFIVSRDDPLAGAADVPLAALADRTWLLREEGSGTRSMVEEILAEAGITPRTLTLGSNGAITQAVRVGLGVSIQSRAAVELELRSGFLASVGLREPLPERRWYALRSSTGPLRPAVAAFLDFLRSSEAAQAIEAATRF
jgi:LysR family transcriptional regulator, low CO2-responsive transcriptional regulator